MSKLILNDTIYNLSLDVIERGKTDIGFVKKRLRCSDSDANEIIKQMRSLGVIEDYKEEAYGNIYDATITSSEFEKRYISGWASKGFPRGQ